LVFGESCDKEDVAMETRAKNLRSPDPTRSLMPALVLACCLVPFQTPAFAQVTTGPQAERGHTSGPGELQGNPRERTMDPARPTAAVPIDGRIEEMEPQLARPPGVLSVNSQPPVDPGQAAHPPHGSGDQKRRPEAGQPPALEAHLHLVLRISESGGAEVVSATEVPGEAVASEAPIGSFITEVTSDKGTLAVEAIQDPFELRSFPGAPGTPTQGHHISRAQTATIVVEVPKINLASATLDKLQVRVHSIKPGPPITEINPAVLQRLLQEGRLELRSSLGGAELAQQVREKGRLLVAPQLAPLVAPQ